MNNIEENLNESQKPQLNIPDVIGSYILDGIEKDYTKEILRGDIAILTIDMIRILLDYMKNNGYDDVYITPLITELTNKGLEFANNYR
jgi:hypothetical protein